MMGLDERTSRGHVDDFWIVYRNYGPDPYLVNNWVRHADEDCTGDFMGTNQSIVGNPDGTTRFFFIPDGSPLFDYTGSEPARRDGCHGLRLFCESRGYQVIENYTQLIQGVYGNTMGFTFSQFREEIDNGRPVLLQLSGHTMVGMGYSINTGMIFLHDTWDHNIHTMAWGGNYYGMGLWGVTVLRLQSDSPPPLTDFMADQTSVCSGQSVHYTDLTMNGAVSWEWSFEGGDPPVSNLQNPDIVYNTPGIYKVCLKTVNQNGYDTEIKFNYIEVTDSCYCIPPSSCDAVISEVHFSGINSITGAFCADGYSDFTEQIADLYPGTENTLLVICENPMDLPLYCGAWFDWNLDYDFEDTLEFVSLSSTPGYRTFSALINPPVGSVGTIRMRVRLFSDSTLNSCIFSTCETEDYSLILHPVANGKLLNIKVFPEGLFDPVASALRKVSIENVPVFQGTVADIMDVKLASGNPPYCIDYEFFNVSLNENGYLNLLIPAEIDESHYIIAKHRNSMETWSAQPVELDAAEVTYDFTDFQGKAFGDNLKTINTSACLFSGDCSQDGIVDSGDMIMLDNSDLMVETGYFPEDMNGDGLVDLEDYIIVESNTLSFIVICRP
jgi:PKD repeat protein